jgi:hypothetical protein
MTLSSKDAALLLDKYLAPDAPPIVGILATMSASSAKVSGRLRRAEGPNGVAFTVASASGDVLCLVCRRYRVEYKALPPPAGFEELKDALKAKFEDALAVISESGERLYIIELKVPHA